MIIFAILEAIILDFYERGTNYEVSIAETLKTL